MIHLYKKEPIDFFIEVVMKHNLILAQAVKNSEYCFRYGHLILKPKNETGYKVLKNCESELTLICHFADLAPEQINNVLVIGADWDFRLNFINIERATQE